VVGQEYEARLSKTLLPRVTVADVQAVANHCRVENSCLVKAIAHKKCVPGIVYLTSHVTCCSWLDLLPHMSLSKPLTFYLKP